MKKQHSKCVVLAVDVMGGDLAPEANINGVNDFFTTLDGTQDVFFKFYGDSSAIENLLSRTVLKKSDYEVIHTEEIIETDEKPTSALRNKKNSSMYKAIEAVKRMEADAVVSSGNTGALMAISKILLGTLSNVSRPAIVQYFPSLRDGMAVLDLGANLDCNSEILTQFAYMGAAFVTAVRGITNPKIGILNIGSESNKGTDALKETFVALQQTSERLNFVGFIEPNNLFHSDIDVIVTDGFSGNIMLKSVEGTISLFSEILKRNIVSSILGVLLSPLIKRFLKKSLCILDPKLYNGAMIIGLNGNVVKSHGAADRKAFSNALKIAINIVKFDINRNIIEKLENLEY